MPTHSEAKILPYTCEQLFSIVSDVDKYDQFLPWCVASRVRKREGNVIVADLVIGYKMVREKFTSHVTLTEPNMIEVAYIDGPFKYLKNIWKFDPDDQGHCVVDFYVDFEFKSKIFDKMIGPLFHDAVHRMVTAFENRVQASYPALTVG